MAALAGNQTPNPGLVLAPNSQHLHHCWFLVVLFRVSRQNTVVWPRPLIATARNQSPVLYTVCMYTPCTKGGAAHRTQTPAAAARRSLAQQWFPATTPSPTKCGGPSGPVLLLHTARGASPRWQQTCARLGTTYPGLPFLNTDNTLQPHASLAVHCPKGPWGPQPPTHASGQQKAARLLGFNSNHPGSGAAFTRHCPVRLSSPAHHKPATT